MYSMHEALAAFNGNGFQASCTLEIFTVAILKIKRCPKATPPFCQAELRVWKYGFEGETHAIIFKGYYCRQVFFFYLTHPAGKNLVDSGRLIRC